MFYIYYRIKAFTDESYCILLNYKRLFEDSGTTDYSLHIARL